MVMFWPLGTLGTYAETGSPKRSLPSCASSTISAAVMVLVFEATRKWEPPSGGLRVPNSVVPTAARKVTCGVRSTTIAPGTSSLAAADSTTAWNAAGSMVFRAAGSDEAPAGAPDEASDETSDGAPDWAAQPATRSVTHAATAIRRRCLPQRRPVSLVPKAFSARQSVIAI